MIGDLYIEKTATTPEVLIKTNGDCRISGNFKANGIDDKFIEVKEAVRWLIARNASINFTFQFDYYNTLSQRYVYDLFYILTLQKSPGKIIWYYKKNDEDIEEMGVFFKNMFPVLHIKVKEL
jgi:hypothetical protein